MSDRAAISSRIAHDLKAALSPIQTSAYVLKQGDAVAEAVRNDMVAVIERQTQRLARMIDEASEWQRWCDGGAPLHAAPVDAEFVIAMATGEIPGHPQVRWSGTQGADFLGDEHRLQQMLGALVAFACARDPERAPVCEIALDREGLRVAISDRGPACDPVELLSRPQRAPWDDGLGLGVLIATAIARAHGGGVEAIAPADGGLRLECRVRSLHASN